jgi:hypothetical protein
MQNIGTEVAPRGRGPPLKVVWYNPPYNFKNLTAKLSKRFPHTPGGLVLESGTKLTVRASTITTTRKCVRYRRSLGARFSKRKSGGYTCLHYIVDLPIVSKISAYARAYTVLQL